MSNGQWTMDVKKGGDSFGIAPTLSTELKL